MAVEISEISRKSWRVAIDSVMLTSLVGIGFWCGSIANQMTFLHENVLMKSGGEQISAEAAQRITRLEAREDAVFSTLNGLASRLDRIEERQEAILERLKR